MFLRLSTRARCLSTTIDPKPILSLIDGYRCSKILFTAVDLQIFDHLAVQPLSSEELAKKLNLKHSSALERCLNGCVALKLLNRQGNKQKYSNTKLSETYLVSTSAMALNGYINHNNQSSYSIWNHLSDAVRENAPQWKRTFGKMEDDEFNFNAFYRDENAEIVFMAGMHQLGLTCFPSVVACLENSEQYQTICDIGGGTGCLAISACEANLHLRGIIFDLPAIEKHAIRWLNQTSDDIRHRIRFQSGDFFRDPLPQADLFSLGRILHDWNDQQCEELLTNIYRTLPEKNGGAILIAEKLFNEEKTGPIDVITQDINMLLSTAGKERSASEYKQMLERVGFRDIKCQKTGTYLDAIVAYR